MPLLDHFTEPINPRARWASFHSFWVMMLARWLNRSLPRRFFASVNVHLGSQVAADVAETDYGPPVEANGSGGLAIQTAAPPAAAGSWPASFPDELELPIVDTDADRVVAVIELVSPSNKDRPQSRRAFAGKCAAYLHQGIGVLVADAVVKHHFNLHDELVGLLGLPEGLRLADHPAVYAASYWPVIEGGAVRIDYWGEPMRVGERLPTLPFGLRGWGWVRLDLEESYAEACQECRLP